MIPIIDIIGNKEIINPAVALPLGCERSPKTDNINPSNHTLNIRIVENWRNTESVILYELSPAPIIMALIMPYKKDSTMNASERVNPAVPIRLGVMFLGTEKSVSVISLMFLVSQCILLLGISLQFLSVLSLLSVTQIHAKDKN